MEIVNMTDAEVNQAARDLTQKLVKDGRKDEARELLKKYDALTVSYLFINYPSRLRRYLVDLRALPIAAPGNTEAIAAPKVSEKAYIIPEGKLYVTVEGCKVSAEVHTETVDVKLTTKFKTRSEAVDYWVGITEKSAGAYFARLLKNI